MGRSMMFRRGLALLLGAAIAAGAAPALAQNAAQIAGLKVGDRIVAVTGRDVTNVNQLITDVRDSAGTSLTLLVERSGHEFVVHATPVDGRTLTSGGARLSTGPHSHGFLGIELSEQTVHDSWLGAIPRSFTEVASLVGTAAHALVHVFSPGQFASLIHQVASPAAAENPTNQDTRPESIVGVVRLAVQSTAAGPALLLDILITVNVFVGLLNMLPMLPLDGGYVAVATYERIRSRRGRVYHADVNKLAPAVYAFMSLLLVLFACTVYLDIVHPIANPF